MKPKFMFLAMMAAAALLAGCSTSARLNDVRIGMTKDQVIAILGVPDSTTAQANAEYLTYYLLSDSGYGRDQPYLVRLVNGKVESFGRFAQLYDLYSRPVTNATPGDPNFPSAAILGGNVYGAPAAVAVPSAGTDLAGQIQKLKALKDQGVLTEEEFQAAKHKLLSESK